MAATAWRRFAVPRSRAACRNSFRPRLEPFEDRLALAVITWINPGSGEWTDPGNWDLGRLPDAADDARILTADITVTHSGGTNAVRSLESNAAVNLDGGSLLFGAATSSIYAPFTIGPGGRLQWLSTNLQGSGMLVNRGMFVIQGGSAFLRTFIVTEAGSTLRVEGTDLAAFTSLNVTTGLSNHGAIELVNNAAGNRDVRLFLNGTLVNADTGIIRSLAGTGGGELHLVAPLANQGTVAVGAGLEIANYSPPYEHSNNGTITITAGSLSMVGRLTNRGTVNVTGGDWTLSGDGVSTNMGTITVVAGRVMRFLGSNYQGRFNPGTGITGTFQFVGAVLGSGTINSSTTFVLNSARIAPDATLVNQGTLLVRQAYCEGTLVNAAGAMLRVEATDTVVEAGLGSANGFTNYGTIELLNSAAVARPVYLGATNGSLVNAPGATIRVPAGVGGGTRTLDAQLDNRGTLNVDVNLSMNRPASAHSNSGTINVGAGTLTVSYYFGAIASFTNTGTINLGGGNLTLSGTGIRHTRTTSGMITIAAGRTLTVDVGRLDYTAGRIGGRGTLSIQNTYFNLGVDFSNAETTLALRYALVEGAGTLTNAPGRTLTFADGGRITAPFVNRDTVVFQRDSFIDSLVSNPVGSTIRIESVGDNYARLTVRSGFTNYGTIELANPTALPRQVSLIVSNGTLVNAPGAILSMPGGTSSGSRFLDAELDNQGVITVPVQLSLVRGGAAHRNSGAIHVTGGDLSVSAFGASGSFTNTGTITIAAGRTLFFRDGQFNYNDGSITGPGTFAVQYGSAVLNLGIDLSTAVVGFTADGATVNGPGTLINAAGRTMVLAYATVNAPLVNQGTLVFASGLASVNGSFLTAIGSTLRVEVTLDFALASLTVLNGFTNYGTIELVNTLPTSQPATLAVTNGTLVNAEGATLDARPGPNLVNRVLNAQLDNRGTLRVRHPLTVSKDGAAHVNAPAGTILVEAGLSVTGASVTNAGVIRQSAGATNSMIQAAFQNTGTVEVLAGTLTLMNGGSNAGSLSVASGSTIAFVGGTHAVGGSVLGTGTIRFAFGSSTVTGAYEVGATDVGGGTVTFSSPAASTGTLQNAAAGGTILIPATGTLTVLGNFTQVRGTTTIDAGRLLSFGLLDLRGGSLNIFDGGWAYGYAGVTNSANLLARSSGIVLSDGPITQTAGTTTLVNNGILYAPAVNLQGGTMVGSGYVFGNLTNAGRIQVGGANMAGSLYVFGNYIQTASGRLDIELGGPKPGVDHDFLYVDGTTTLAGTLNLSLLGTYRPNPDDFFVFFWSNGGIIGDFGTVNGTDLGSGLFLYPFTDGFGYYLFAYLV